MKNDEEVVRKRQKSGKINCHNKMSQVILQLPENVHNQSLSGLRTALRRSKLVPKYLRLASGLEASSSGVPL